MSHSEVLHVVGGQSVGEALEDHSDARHQKVLAELVLVGDALCPLLLLVDMLRLVVLEDPGL